MQALALEIHFAIFVGVKSFQNPFGQDIPFNFGDFKEFFETHRPRTIRIQFTEPPK